MAEPIHISEGLAWEAPSRLPPFDLDEVCRGCGRRRGDHYGPKGTLCPAGRVWLDGTAFDGSGRSETPARVVEGRLVIHALRPLRMPRYAARRGMGTVAGTGAAIEQCVLEWVLTNRAELEG
jgi:hypothetical protein